MSPRLIRKIIQKKKLSRIILQIWNNFFQELKIPTPRHQKILWETHYNIGMYSWRLEDWRKSGCIELYSERLEKVLIPYSWRLEYWRESDCIKMYSISACISGDFIPGDWSTRERMIASKCILYRHVFLEIDCILRD